MIVYSASAPSIFGTNCGIKKSIDLPWKPHHRYYCSGTLPYLAAQQAEEAEKPKEEIQTIKIEDKQSIPEPSNKDSEEARAESNKKEQDKDEL